MIQIGNLFFRHRNWLGPTIFLAALALSHPRYPWARADLNIAFDIAGAGLALSGQLLRILTIGYEYIVRGGRDRRVYADDLVQGGLFALCRNPLYLGNVLIVCGIALVVHAYAFYLIALPGAIFIYSAIVAAEESYLLHRFGDVYRDYMRRVNRWRPHFGRLRASVNGIPFDWRRVLIKEYNTTFLLVAALVCVRVWSEYRIAGAAALPSLDSTIGSFIAWALLYLGVRALKKCNYIQD